jgi:hypothetical protein
LGYADPSITLGIYSHVAESMSRRAASGMDSIVRDDVGTGSIS